MNIMNLDLTPATIERIVEHYVAVWSEPDPAARRAAIAGLWASDAVEYVEEAQFQGIDELDARIAEAYDAFVGSGTFAVVTADDPHDATGHHDSVTFTIQLVTPGGDVAWAARIFLILGTDGLIRRDYQFTVKPLDPQ